MFHFFTEALRLSILYPWVMLTIFLTLDTKEDPSLKDVEETMVETIALCQRNSHNLNQQQREVGEWLQSLLKVCSGLKLEIKSISTALSATWILCNWILITIQCSQEYMTLEVIMGRACLLCSHKKLYILRFGYAAKLRFVNTRCPCSLWTKILCILCSGTMDVSSIYHLFYSLWIKWVWRTGRKASRDREKAGKGQKATIQYFSTLATPESPGELWKLPACTHDQLNLSLWGWTPIINVVLFVFLLGGEGKTGFITLPGTGRT